MLSSVFLLISTLLFISVETNPLTVKSSNMFCCPMNLKCPSIDVDPTAVTTAKKICPEWNGQTDCARWNGCVKVKESVPGNRCKPSKI